MPAESLKAVVASTLRRRAVRRFRHQPGARLVVFGDSYALGAGATRGNGYANVTARNLAVPVLAMGHGGSGFLAGSNVRPRRHYRARLDALVAARPDTVVIQASVNDRFWAPPEIEQAQRAFFAALTERRPPTVLLGDSIERHRSGHLGRDDHRLDSVYVLGPIWHPETDHLRVIREITQRVAGELRLPYIDPAGWIPDAGGPLIAADGAHLNDAGHEEVGSHLAIALT